MSIALQNELNELRARVVVLEQMVSALEDVANDQQRMIEALCDRSPVAKERRKVLKLKQADDKAN